MMADAKTALAARGEYLKAKLRDTKVSELMKRHVIDVELPMLEAAMQRAKEGTYGLCIDCGEKISERRLKAIPEVPHCIACRPARSTRKE